MINAALRAAAAEAKGRKAGERPVTESILRKVLREELASIARNDNDVTSCYAERRSAAR